MTKEEFTKAWLILKKQTKGLGSPWIDRDSRQKRDPFRVLISCIISLRTQDKVTEQASERLFFIAPTPEQVIELGAEEVARLIYPAGFYRTKAERIVEICRELVNRYNSKVPETIDELLEFKGVGRKTANLVITAGYDKPGICVDTHVHRITNRWGLIDTANPEATEEALKLVVPKRYWKEINPYLVSFGQNLCKPLSPICTSCKITRYCDKKGVKRFR